MKVLILSNHQHGLYKFRKELMEEMVRHNYKVYVSVPEDGFSQEIQAIGCRMIPNKYLNRRGTNPLQDIQLLCYYKRLVEKVKPDVALTYTVKPNVYGGAVCAACGVPYIATVTGLGTSIENGGILQQITLYLYRFGLRKARKVFFQNKENCKYMLLHHVVKRDRIEMTPGSGVNTLQHCYEPYPPSEDTMIFTTIGRIMKDKGIDELLQAAEQIRARHPHTKFRLIGDFDGEYKEKIRILQKQNIVEYIGLQKDIHPFLKESHAIIHASYHEGMSNVLQEAASTGRPVLATDVHGCIETFEPDVTGISFKAKSADSLIKAIEKFLSLTYAQKEAMGKAGREKMKKEFDRRIVVDKYMKVICKEL